MNQACNRELSLMAKTVQKKYLLGFHHGNRTPGLPQLALGHTAEVMVSLL